MLKEAASVKQARLFRFINDDLLRARTRRGCGIFWKRSRVGLSLALH